MKDSVLTDRGFQYTEFTDSYGNKCSVQESSSAMEPKVWVGVNDANLQELIPGRGWTPVKMPDNEWVASTRMHLTLPQTKELIDILQSWVKENE
jgi:hypothetical protein